jgi:hypothetical protein
MAEPTPNRLPGYDVVRRGKLVLLAVLAGAALTACGDSGGDSAVVTAPPGTTPGAGAPSPAGSGGAAQAGGAGNAGAAQTDGPGSAGAVGAATDSAASTDAVPDADGDRSATLSWNPPTEYEDGTPLKLTGYRIYWGPMDDYYPNSVTVENPGLTRYVVENLAPATWYFTVTALADKVESPPSNVLKMEIR